MEKESNKWRGSSKINALMNDLKLMSENDPTVKTIVFSQWTSMLDLVEIPLKNAGYKVSIFLEFFIRIFSYFSDIFFEFFLFFMIFFNFTSFQI